MNTIEKNNLDEPVMATAVNTGFLEKLKKSNWIQKVASTPWMLAASISVGIFVCGIAFIVCLSVVGSIFSGESNSSGYTQWHDGGFSDGRGGYRSKSGFSTGTFDEPGSPNSVIGYDGEVLNLPPY